MSSSPRALLVEDESLVALLIEEMLQDLGFAVEVAGRLDEGLARAAEGRLSIAVLDVNLGGARSYPIADALSARGIPFLFATGYGTNGLENRYKHIPTVQKPFGQGDLKRVIERALAT